MDAEDFDQTRGRNTVSEETTITIRVGELTENELHCVIGMVGETILEPLGIELKSTSKPKPMYRDIVICGPWKAVEAVAMLCQDCEIIREKIEPDIKTFPPWVQEVMERHEKNKSRWERSEDDQPE